MIIQTNIVSDITACIVDTFNPNQEIQIFVGDQNGVDILELIKALNQSNCSFTGFVVPGILNHEEVKRDGILIKSWPLGSPAIVIRDISNLSYDFSSFDLDGIESAMIFADYRIENGSGFLFDLFNQSLSKKTVFGGAVGGISDEDSNCIFNESGFFDDAAVILSIDSDLVAKAHHGFTQGVGPLIVSKTDGKSICEINWKEASEVYKNAIEEMASTKFEAYEDLYSTSLRFPLGIFREGQEFIIRDIVMDEDKSNIQSLVEIESNAVLYVMKHDIETLIEAARQSMRSALEKVGDRKVNDLFFVNCVSRWFLLKDDFKREVMELSSMLENIEHPLEGIMSYGEICSGNNNLLEIYNKTIVAGLFTEKVS